ncbi:MAG TPA: zinc ABC transporter substrate-binding protein, partial [Terriglobales bacterium]|nr:zinc ABC transporter substrate-binding protein [Terriglobales bacterium]
MKKSMRTGAAMLLSLSLTVLGGCGAKGAEDPALQSGDAAGKPVVAVTIVPEATFVKAVCGDAVEVVTLVPPGYSPENYEPTPME